MSSCTTLNYNFTSLSERDRQLYAESVCNCSASEPMVCCSERVSVTDSPGPDVCGDDTNAGKITGGENAQLDEYRWMALLEYRNRKPLSIHIEE